MINTQEVLKNVEANQGEMEKKEVISKILQIMKRIQDTPITDWEMHSLVDHVYTLCKFMDNLSDLKEYAYIRAETLGEEYKTRVRDEYLKIKDSGEKVTDTLARAMAEKNSDPTKQEELEAIHQSRRLRELYENVSRMINFTQTKIKSMDDSRVRTNIPNN